MIENNNKEIKFTGKEYLDYIKYKDKNKYKLNEKDKNKILIGSISLLFLVGIGILIDTLLPNPTPKPITWNGILMFVSICVGLSWIVHGVGFTLIKR